MAPRPTDPQPAKPATGLSRRTILRTGGAALGLAAAGYVGWQFRPVTRQHFVTEASLPPEAPAQALAHPEAAPSLLVVYASMMGSTGDQAQILAREMRQQGFRTRLARIEEMPDPAEFDAVMLGSAIRGAKWLDPMLDWARSHRAALADRPHALFQCSMTCAGLQLSHPDGVLSPADLARLEPDLDAIREAVPDFAAAPVQFFPGRLEFARLEPALRLFYPVVSGSTLQGDFRKPEQLRAYARQIAARPDFAGLARALG